MHERDHDSISERWRFIDLPLELIQTVLEWAARLDDGSTACALCRVSRMVYKWIAPILYETVVYDIGWDPELQPMDDGSNFVHPHHSHMIKHLYVTVGEMINLGQCSQLRYLVVHAELLGTTSPPTIPSLSHLVIYGPLSFDIIKYPILRSVTHLRLLTPGSGDICPAAWTPENLPSLTHLVLAVHLWIPSPAIHEWRDFLTSLHAFTKFHVVGLYTSSRWATHPRYVTMTNLPYFLKRIGGHRGHPKLVFLTPRTFVPAEWDDWVRGGESIWEEAEYLLKSPA
jgi:hypothetical protein